MQLFRKLCLIGIAAISAFQASGAETASDSAFSYVPKFNGVIRPRWEMSTTGAGQHFAVRNAMLSVSGSILPSAGYFVQADFCNSGQIMFLDAFAKFMATKEIAAQAGQFRMPLGVDLMRPPHGYYFANRSFISRYMCNVRSIGVMGTYDMASFPLRVDAGVFNASTMVEHNKWSKSVAASAKAQVGLGEWKLTAGLMTIKPAEIRSHLINAAASWTHGRLMLEGEYLLQAYSEKEFDTAQGWNIMADYHVPLNIHWINRISFQGRYDGMTAHTNIYSGDLESSRNRATVGITAGYYRTTDLFVAFRLNYEQYFYHHDAIPAPGEDSKLVAEVIFHF